MKNGRFLNNRMLADLGQVSQYQLNGGNDDTTSDVTLGDIKPSQKYFPVRREEPEAPKVKTAVEKHRELLD